ncbi:Putative lipoprotein LppC [Fundidesulfovibrio magnetotacticus]|uniref:Lipoprotein LppC n=1 Tax=Fundidesulfovibrio magnetotacticus TaxID=2730080 RepID=A0A6V8LU08_9BACT|nr:YbhB/YbcL family Raf kinase inhibitor-like protein [Fundidesulfovibrio magnetotacticus]GFK93589.1 Putative lipoprotein LppC [Fundidesulfovibrio magnetotacticus]
MKGFARAAFLAALFLFLAGAEARASALSVSSPAFKDGERMPRQSGCEGGDRSPPLQVVGVPGEAKSLAILMTEQDSPRGQQPLWIAYNLAPTYISIAENQPRTRQLKGGGMQIALGNAKPGYTGPCPPAGVTRRYLIEVFALDSLLDLPENATKQDFLLAVEGHILVRGWITGRYKK